MNEWMKELVERMNKWISPWIRATVRATDPRRRRWVEAREPRLSPQPTSRRHIKKPPRYLNLPFKKGWK